jgi:hypothetical protein
LPNRRDHIAAVLDQPLGLLNHHFGDLNMAHRRPGDAELSPHNRFKLTLVFRLVAHNTVPAAPNEPLARPFEYPFWIKKLLSLAVFNVDLILSFEFSA